MLMTDVDKYNLNKPKPITAMTITVKDTVNITIKVAIKGAYKEVIKLIDEYCLKYVLSKEELDIIDDDNDNENDYENYSAQIDVTLNDQFKPVEITSYFNNIAKFINNKYEE